MEAVYGTQRSVDDDLIAMRRAFGSWNDREPDSAAWVDQMRSGARLLTRNIRHFPMFADLRSPY